MFIKAEIKKFSCVTKSLNNHNKISIMTETLASLLINLINEMLTSTVNRNFPKNRITPQPLNYSILIADNVSENLLVESELLYEWQTV